MRRDPHTERLRAALAELERSPRPTDECPSAEVMLHTVRAELDADSIRMIGRHAMVCADCARAWRLARDIADDRLPEEVNAARGIAAMNIPLDPVLSFGRWGGVVVAAAAAMATIVMVQVQDSPVDPVRGAGPVVSPEPVISLVPADEALPRDAFLLRWEGPPGARYTLRVMTEELTLLREIPGLETAGYLIPSSVLEGVPAGSRIVWQVTAFLPDGRRHVSPSFVSTVGRR